MEQKNVQTKKEAANDYSKQQNIKAIKVVWHPFVWHSVLWHPEVPQTQS